MYSQSSKKNGWRCVSKLLKASSFRKMVEDYQRKIAKRKLQAATTQDQPDEPTQTTLF
jgi:hypothetical protein